MFKKISVFIATTIFSSISYADIYVPQDYPTIQQAINASPNRGKIIVGPGTYKENLRINKDLTIVAKNPFETFLVPVNLTGLMIESSIVHIEGITVQYGKGIDAIGTGHRVGGAAAIFDSYVEFSRCIFQFNEAVLGGAIYSNTSYVLALNCIFYKNQSYREGGAIYSINNGIEIHNCTIIKNISHGGYTGGIYVTHISTTALITNTILWDNIVWGKLKNQQIYTRLADISRIFTIHCNIQKGFWGFAFNNIDQNPIIMNNFELHEASPCINAGDQQYSHQNAIVIDIDGDSRIVQGMIDIGAQEFQWSETEQEEL